MSPHFSSRHSALFFVVYHCELNNLEATVGIKQDILRCNLLFSQFIIFPGLNSCVSTGRAQQLRCPQHPRAHPARRLRVQPRRGGQRRRWRSRPGFHQRSAGYRQPAAEDPQGQRRHEPPPARSLCRFTVFDLTCEHADTLNKHHTGVRDWIEYLVGSDCRAVSSNPITSRFQFRFQLWCKRHQSKRY